MRGRRVVIEIAKIGYAAGPRWFIGAVALTLVGPMAVLSIPLAARYFIDGIVAGDPNAIRSSIVLFTFGGAMTWTVAVLDGVVSNGLGSRVEPALVSRLGEDVCHAPTLADLEDPETLERLQLVQNERYQLLAGPKALVAVMQFAFRAVCIIALLALVQPWLILLAVLAPAPFIAQRFADRARKAAEVTKGQDALLANRTFQLSTSAEMAGEIRVWGLHESLKTKHAEASSRLVRAEAKALAAELTYGATGWVLFIGGLLLGLWIVASGVIKGELGLGDVVMVVLLAQMIGSHVSEGVPLASALASAAAATRRLLGFEEAVSATARPAGTQTSPTSLRTGITLDGLSFRYRDAASDAVTDLSVTIPAGQCVAIVGANGAGKTSLVNLLAGLQRPTAGRILVDETELEQIAADEWHRSTTATFQDFVRYSLSLRLNVGLGYLPLSDDDEAIDSALEAARASDLPVGLDDILSADGSTGRGLSGGQWQKIAVARGLLHPAPLLVLLDEPTASLDAQVEHDLFLAYLDASKSFANRTGAISVITTHRFALARSADLILVLEDGHLVEHGDHQTLVERGGYYAELFEAQAAGYR